MFSEIKYPLLASSFFFVISIIILFVGEPTLNFYVSVDTPSDLHITIEKRDYLFKAKNTNSYKTKGSNTYNVISTNYNNIKNLSLTFNSKNDSKIKLFYALLKQPGYQPIHFDINQIKLGGETQLINISNTLSTIGKNQKFTLNSDKLMNPKIDFRAILMLFLFSIILFLILAIFNFKSLINISYSPRSLLIPFALLTTFFIALNMAIESRYNTSPDEKDHFLAAEFFKDHSKTPIKGSNDAIFSYNSTWNYSRAYNKELDYLLTGKFSNLFKKMPIESYKSIRFFNVSLIFLLFIVSLLFPQYNIILLPFVIAPEPWYIMSYVNNGALPLFLSFLILIITEKNREIFSLNFSSTKKKYIIILLGLILGAILLSKRNYLIFAFSYIIYLFFLCNNNLTELNFKKSIQLYKPLLLIISIAFTIFIVRIVSIKAFNNNSPVLTENVQSFYKKSQNNRARLFDTHRAGKDRFGSYLESTKEWLKGSYKSFNGNYGSMQYFSSSKYYNRLIIIHILIIFLLSYYAITNYSKSILISFIILISVASLLFFASSYIYSYNYDFQAQGKYLLPILPVLGMFIYKCKINTKFLLLVTLILFSFSAYSFIFKGILNLK